MTNKETTIQKKLSYIQKNLKVPKANYNDFGRYNYRSCEDILESVKPILDGCTLILSDELINIGDRYYIKATATLTYEEESVNVSSYAREEQNKKGMDGSQITGASSSYARKYALNGLFLIDDTKDSDATNKGEYKKNKTPLETQREKLKKVTDSENEETAKMIEERNLKIFNEYKEELGACEDILQLTAYWSTISKKLTKLGKERKEFLINLKDEMKDRFENENTAAE
jgi:hypothetical protein